VRTGLNYGIVEPIGVRMFQVMAGGPVSNRLMQVVALIALVGPQPAWAGRSARPSVAVTSAPPVAVAQAEPTLPSLLSPLEAQLVRPDLMGVDLALDLTTMSRHQITFDLIFDRTPFDAVTLPIQKSLFEVFAADPRWRVTEEDGAMIAYLRVADGAGWSVPRSGYHRSADGATWRVDVRAGAWDPTSRWLTSPYVKHLPPGIGKARMTSWVMADPAMRGLHASAMSIESPGVAVDLFEAGGAVDRPHTSAGLVQAQQTIMTVVGAAAYFAREGGAAARVPAAEPAAPGVVLVTAPSAGTLDLRARVNPGVPGWTWVRLVSDRGPWNDAAVGAGTRERVGFSSDPTRGFYMQSAFPAPQGPGFTGTAEVWFKPDDGGPARKLSSTVVTVPAR
jgi:hypothetical protein